MTDHYELLGVDADASKDEIKAAYRSEVENADSSRRAELNRAWNVLSDPIQRERYDEQLGDASAGSDDADVTVVVPSRRTTGARRGPQSEALASNGSSTNGSGTNGAAAADAAASGLPANKIPTIVVPEGLVLAPPKSRSMALAIDFLVLVLLFFAVYSLGASIIKNQYPAETHNVDALSKASTAADKAKSKADDAKDSANSALDKAKKSGNSTQISNAQDKADSAKAKADAADKHATKVSSDYSDAQGKLRTPYLLVYLAVLVLSLIYCVPSSVRTGQTLGKRLRKVRLVRVDGSAPGWTAALVHYGVPIFLTLALVQVLGPLAVVLGLGVVLWNLRDRNRQGVNDKLAKTFVVEA
jgi:curved DNA-binding protein CbpA